MYVFFFKKNHLHLLSFHFYLKIKSLKYLYMPLLVLCITFFAQI